MTKNRLLHPAARAGFWILFGVLFWFCVPSYRYTAFLFWGYGAARLGYAIAAHIGKNKPRLGRTLRTALTICLCLVLLAAGITEGLIVSGAKGAKDPECDYVLVLGAGVNGTVPSLSLAQRLQAAFDYLHTYPGATCIVSGGMGSGERITEAQCMYTWLTDRGIDPERIIMEQQATTTDENIRYTLELLEAETGQRPQTLAVISSEYHLYRAGQMAQQQGVSMLGVPAETKPLPLKLHYYFREMFALWYYEIFG